MTGLDNNKTKEKKNNNLDIENVFLKIPTAQPKVEQKKIKVVSQNKIKELKLFLQIQK